MNIFYLHNDPKVCAEMHNDKHCVKMILEYAQLLSTSHRVLDGRLTVGRSKTGRKQTKYIIDDDRDNILYSTTHTNHPSAIWVRQSNANYAWLYQMFGALMDEYSYRYGKTHACKKLVNVLSYHPKNIPEGTFTEPTPAMPDEYKAKDSIQSYKNYYNGAKTHIAKWTKRNAPEWFNA
jgi:hypothetical protein